MYEQTIERLRAGDLIVEMRGRKRGSIYVVWNNMEPSMPKDELHIGTMHRPSFYVPKQKLREHKFRAVTKGSRRFEEMATAFFRRE